MEETTKHKIREALHQREKKSIVDEGLTPAAVLLIIYCKADEHYILFTKRTEKVTYHKGQISFPGGAHQEDDQTLLNTALRENCEELGLAARDIEILGELDDVATATSSYVITPFVASIPWPYRFMVSKEEIDGIIEVPVAALLDKANLREEVQTIQCEATPVYFYHYQEQVIWGATARILKQFLDILSGEGK